MRDLNGRVTGPGIRILRLQLSLNRRGYSNAATRTFWTQQAHQHGPTCRDLWYRQRRELNNHGGLQSQHKTLGGTRQLTTQNLFHSNFPDERARNPKRKIGTPWRTAYIAVGSNIDNRLYWIENALDEMKKANIIVKRTSSLWETEPMYVVDQNKFLNGVVEIETILSPGDLLISLQRIEKGLGRVKIQEKGPRNIDLDILLYEKEIVNTPNLIIPHPLMLEREFVLRPLAELIPDVEIDQSQPGKTTAYFLDALPPPSSPMYSLTYLAPSSKNLSERDFPPLSPLNPSRSTRIMGIANITPDSFSDGGKFYHSGKHEGSQDVYIWSAIHDYISTLEDASKSNSEVYPNGIIDVGGQSTAPGAPEVPVKEETRRVVEALKHIKTSSSLISIDTYRAPVAQAAIEHYAHIINDVSAGLMDPEMLATVSRAGVSVILMHMRGTPATMAKLTNYEPQGLIPTIASELLERIKAAEEAGIYRWRIVLDPGIGFAKTAEQNLEILKRFHELREWPGLKGFAWLVGSSRKGFIGKVTGVRDPKARVLGSMVAVTAAIQGGADIVRVHDVTATSEVVKMADAIWRSVVSGEKK